MDWFTHIHETHLTDSLATTMHLFRCVHTYTHRDKAPCTSFLIFTARHEQSTIEQDTFPPAYSGSVCEHVSHAGDSR